MEAHQTDLETLELNLMMTTIMFQIIELSYHLNYNYIF